MKEDWEPPVIFAKRLGLLKIGPHGHGQATAGMSWDDVLDLAVGAYWKKQETLRLRRPA